MSELIVVGYKGKLAAEEVRLQLLKMRRTYFSDLEDAVVAVKERDGQVRLHQVHNLTACGSLAGGFWEMLVSTLFLSPVLGVASEVATAALSCALTDVGINDNFMKDLAATLQPGSSALFVLVRKAPPDKVLEELRGTGGKVLHTSLTHEKEEKLQAALDTVASRAKTENRELPLPQKA